MKSKAWVELKKWARANLTKRAIDIDFQTQYDIIVRLTKDEQEEYLHFSAFHQKRTESKNCVVCSRCWRAMGFNDRKFHYCGVAPYNTLTLFKIIDETYRCCQRATLFAMWTLRKMGMHKDCVIKIGKLVYASAWDVFLWAPTHMYTRTTKRTWKEKRKEPLKFQF